MRLPHRVPWSSLAELDQLCSWIYSDENNKQAKLKAVIRLSAWNAITVLPHALESTLALLVVIVQDTQKTYTSSLFLRQGYASAILRLINGLVDRLQVGTYARSIASIASQLGIPSWLVELRHACTHEDLPGVDLLREASRQAMSWLLHNYFLPMLNPVVEEPVFQPLRPLTPSLKSYKNMMKLLLQDASLISDYKPKITALFRDIERWISEAKVVANVATGEIGWATGPSDNNARLFDAKEIWALAKFCDILAEEGILVPLSKRKRQPSDDLKYPNASLTSLWQPLLQEVQASHPTFPSVLCKRLASIVMRQNPAHSLDDDKSNAKESAFSYSNCLILWISWSIDVWQDVSPSIHLKKDLLMDVLSSLELAAVSSASNSGASSAASLLRMLASHHPQLGDTVVSMIELLSAKPERWDANDLQVMNERLFKLRSTIPTERFEEVLAAPMISPRKECLIPGWTELGDTWIARPIGVYSRNYV